MTIPHGTMLEGYQAYPGGVDELLEGKAYDHVAPILGRWNSGEFQERQRRADLALLNAGITFTVYGDEEGLERIFPFSLIPRIIEADEWEQLARGLVQRVRALNAFLLDLYGEQRAIKDGVIPSSIAFGAPDLNLAMVDVEPPLGVYTHVVGCDLIRNARGEYVVLEDNLRTPSGVSYVIENRRVMLNVVPELFDDHQVARVGDYPVRLLETLIDVRPAGVSREETRVVLLTPGSANSAYFEHAFLAQQMGIDLVEGRDLLVHDGRVFLRSTSGLEPIHVIYRRIDDAFLDPLAGRPDSVLGVAGLVNAYRAGNVTLANAPGAGVADNKSVYRFAPNFIRYYLDEEPIIPNVPTYLGALPEDRRTMLSEIDQLVVKPTNASGGYGIVVGPTASADELRAARAEIEREPEGWIAQPLVEFSSIPTYQNGKIVPRRADFRPYVLTGDQTWVLPGGLTRVALVEGSYIVNSSQGGGSKDTWVLSE
jgi:uncharacterized circularly permuted ATP-grasp superfamily protein